MPLPTRIRFPRAKAWPRIGLAASLMAAVLFLAAAKNEVDDERVGAVTAINGPAFALQDAVPRPLAKDSGIFLGDVISTGKGAQVELRMVDEAQFTLGERTLFVVQEYFLNQGGNGNAAVRLMTGAVQVVTGKIAQLDSKPFRLETEVATIGVRGTTFWGGLLDGIHQFALLEGDAITVENKAGRIEINQVGQGTAVPDAGTAPAQPISWAQDKLRRAADITRVR